MPKTNYSKAEGSFEDGMRKMMVNNLLTEADVHQGKDVKKPGEDKKKLVLALHHSLRYLQKNGKDPYVKLGILRKKMEEWINHPEKISEGDWKLIQGYKEAADKLKNPQSAPKEPEKAFDSHVDSERKKNVNLRFNINDKWLPLQ